MKKIEVKNFYIILILLFLTASIYAQADEQQPANKNSPRLGMVGASIGSSFAAPWLIGSVYGTIPLWNQFFFQLGFDYGIGTGELDLDYSSLYPHAAFGYFTSFSNLHPVFSGGWYVSAGGGYLWSKLTRQNYANPTEVFIWKDFSFPVIDFRAGALLFSVCL